MLSTPDPSDIRRLTRRRLRRTSQVITVLGGLGTVAVSAGLAAGQAPSTVAAPNPLVSATPGTTVRTAHAALQPRVQRLQKRRAHRLDAAATPTATPRPTEASTPGPPPTSSPRPTPVAPASAPPSSSSQGS